MPDSFSREEIEEQLLEAMQSARKRYGAKECSMSEYRDALKRFNDFILSGKLPNDLHDRKV